ncbi:hypothetical protein D3C75_1070050 [compost metagenome]
MSRCKCCESILNTYDMKLEKEDGTFEDLCSTCRWYACNDEYLETRSYAFEDITEALLQMKLDTKEDY